MVADCGTKTFAVRDFAATVSTIFCKRLQKASCAQQLVSGTVVQCAARTAHLEPITTIDEDVLIINSATVNVVNRTGNSQTVTGTFLATYDEDVSLNGTRYVNHRGILRKKPAVSTSAVGNITLFREHLSLPFLPDLSLKNLRHIGGLRSEISSRSLGCLILIASS
ncbi:uncharacterized protein LOC135429895 [Drosophila montana]|uniref:uncharacterized protein LOC135429895 n=1 Tax=Drosophila montana TaxID=40370 RepID=UPI00313F3259